MLISTDFDDDDFTRIGSDPDYDPDGVLLPESVQSGGRQTDGARNPSTTRASHKAGERGQQSALVVTGTVVPQGPPRPQNQQQQPQPPQRNPNNAGISRSSSAAGSLGHSRVQTESVAASKPALPINPTTGRVLNQPNRTTASAPQSPVKQGIPVSSNGEEPPGNGGVPAQVGFFSARVADRLPQIPATEGPLPPLPADLVTFNPHAESPSIRRTPGVDHRSSKPLSRDLKPIGIAQGGAAQSPAAVRGNIVNPQFDMARKIGAPGSPSPMANRGSYKAPTMKRPLQQPNLSRPPLGDLPANGNTSAADGGGDTKRPRLSTS
jgi:DNA repair and recombination protein RAD52